MKMSKVDDILQNLILSKETIFSEVSSTSKIKAHYASEASGKKVSQLRSRELQKNMFNEITLECTKRQANWVLHGV